MTIMLVILKSGATLHADVRYAEGGVDYNGKMRYGFKPWRDPKRQQLLYLDPNEVVAVMRLPDVSTPRLTQEEKSE